MYKHNLERTAEYSKNWSDDRVLKYLLDKPNPIIFDVGSNLGQSAVRFRNLWPDSRILCFDPQIELIKQLQTQGFESYGFALGSENTKTTFYNNTMQPAMCSVFPLNLSSADSIALNDPELAGVSTETYLDNANKPFEATVKTLDSVCSELKIKHIDYLKMDVQGSEPYVLAGAQKMIHNIDVIQCEIMLYDLYEKSSSIGEIEKLMPGFKLWDISHISKNPMTGKTDWIDVIYVRNSFPA